MPGRLAKVGGGGRGARSRGESVSCAMTVARAILLPFLIDHFLVLKKEQKAKEREFKIYRKQYQCSVWVLSFALCIRSSKFGVAPLASHAATAPSFRSSHERRHGPMSAPGWRCLKLLNLSTRCSFPRPLPPVPCVPSHLPLTGSSLAMQKEPAPPWTVCWGWGSPGEEPVFWGAESREPREG